MPHAFGMSQNCDRLPFCAPHQRGNTRKTVIVRLPFASVDRTASVTIRTSLADLRRIVEKDLPESHLASSSIILQITPRMQRAY